MKKNTFLIFFLAIIFVASSFSFAKDVTVKGYFRKDGTYVPAHHRSSPDNTVKNNYDYKGNYNPYTKEKGHNYYRQNPTSDFYLTNPKQTNTDNGKPMGFDEVLMKMGYVPKGATPKVINSETGEAENYEKNPFGRMLRNIENLQKIEEEKDEKQRQILMEKMYIYKTLREAGYDSKSAIDAIENNHLPEPKENVTDPDNFGAVPDDDFGAVPD